MKTNIFNILAACGVMFAMSSCDGAWTPPTAPEGDLALGAMDVVNDDAQKLVYNDMSRASDIDLSNYKVSVCPKGGDTPLYTWTYSSMPEVVTLPVGDYTVVVKSHDVQKAEWDNPYFIGSKNFSVANGKITEVDQIVCKFSSVKVTIAYSDLLKEMLTEATVTVKINDLGILNFDLAETRAGYFEALEGSSTMIVTFNGVINGTAVEKNINITDIAAGQHRIITFGSKVIPPVPEQTGSVDPTSGIDISADMVTEDIDGNQTIEEDIMDTPKRPWEPEPEEPGPVTPPTEDAAATFTSTTLNLSGTNDPKDPKYSGDPGTAAVKIDCPKGFANLIVDIKTDNPNFEASVGEMLPMHFDLAYPGDAGEDLGSIGFPIGDEVIGQTSIDFDISQFVPLLGAFSGTHSFTITVKDSEGAEASKALVFKVN